jgi:hypothetical protein
MQPPCPGLSLVTRAGFMVMILDKAAILPAKKSKIAELEKCETSEEQNIERIVHKEFVLAGNVGIFRRELCRQKDWLLHHDNAPSNISFLTREFLPKTT